MEMKNKTTATSFLFENSTDLSKLELTRDLDGAVEEISNIFKVNQDQLEVISHNQYVIVKRSAEEKLKEISIVMRVETEVDEQLNEYDWLMDISKDEVVDLTNELKSQK